MIAPIILTTTTHTQTAEFRFEYKRQHGDFAPVKHARIIIDAYDIIRVVEVPRDKDCGDQPVCTVSYYMENVVKDGEDPAMREVSHINVRHSLDDILTMWEEATREKKEWE